MRGTGGGCIQGLESPTRLSQYVTCVTPVRHLLFLVASAQVTGQEVLGGGVELDPVRRLGEAVALIGEQHVLVLDAGLAQRGDDLLRLGLLYPRVVRALRDKQRDADVARPRQRRARPQERL